MFNYLHQRLFVTRERSKSFWISGIPLPDERLVPLTIPHTENTLSLGVDVPVTDNHFLAARATLGYLVLFLHHHSIASYMHLSHRLCYWQLDDSYRQLTTNIDNDSSGLLVTMYVIQM